MTQLLTPRVFHVPLTEGVKRHASMQGQDFVPILAGLDGDDLGNAPGSPLCKLAILMDPGKVSTPHVHDHVHVYVRLERCGERGVATFYGPELEYVLWLYEGGELWLPPGVPHVAVYPRSDEDDAVVAVALETRTSPDWRADVRPLPDLWPALRRQLVRHDLLRDVDSPPQLVAASASLTTAELGLGGSSCMPGDPDPGRR